LKNNALNNVGALVPISREPQFNTAELDRHRDELNNHFGDEIKLKKRMHELE
jgi:chromosome segregation ATPase